MRQVEINIIPITMTKYRVVRHYQDDGAGGCDFNEDFSTPELAALVSKGLTEQEIADGSEIVQKIHHTVR